jgi:glycosyltransferase involved in cell wall biosynthesis
MEVIKSILGGSVQVYEIIVCFDNPIDSAKKELLANLCQEHGVPLLILENSFKSGSSFSYNRAITAASGNFIALASDDDSWHPSKLQIQLESLGKLKIPAISITGCYYKTEAQTIDVKRPKTLISSLESPLIQIYRTRPFQRTAHRYLPMSSVLFPADLRKLKFDVSLGAREDLWWLHQAFLLGFPTVQIDFPSIRVEASLHRTAQRDITEVYEFAERLNSISPLLASNFLKHHCTRSAIFLGHISRVWDLKCLGNKFKSDDALDMILNIFHLFIASCFLIKIKFLNFIEFVKNLK